MISLNTCQYAESLLPCAPGVMISWPTDPLTGGGRSHTDAVFRPQPPPMRVRCPTRMARCALPRLRRPPDVRRTGDLGGAESGDGPPHTAVGTSVVGTAPARAVPRAGGPVAGRLARLFGRRP